MLSRYPWFYNLPVIHKSLSLRSKKHLQVYRDILDVRNHWKVGFSVTWCQHYYKKLVRTSNALITAI